VWTILGNSKGLYGMLGDCRRLEENRGNTPFREKSIYNVVGVDSRSWGTHTPLYIYYIPQTACVWSHIRITCYERGTTGGTTEVPHTGCVWTHIRITCYERGTTGGTTEVPHTGCVWFHTTITCYERGTTGGTTEVPQTGCVWFHTTITCYERGTTGGTTEVPHTFHIASPAELDGKFEVPHVVPHRFHTRIRW